MELFGEQGKIVPIRFRARAVKVERIYYVRERAGIFIKISRQRKGVRTE